MHKAIAILIASTLSGCAVSGHPRGTPVSPAEVFADPYFEVKAPNSQGWYLMPSSPGEITFGREGPSKIESFIAGVNMFALPATNTPVEFEELIRTGIQKDTPPERYEMQRQALRYTEERGYPCVRIEFLARDKNPRASNTPQLLALDGLYCRHPKQPEAGFSAIYSFRGASEYPGLHTEAQSFTEGVLVPEK